MAFPRSNYVFAVANSPAGTITIHLTSGATLHDVVFDLPFTYQEGGSFPYTAITSIDVYYGTVSGNLANLLVLGNVSSATLPITTGALPETWYFAIDVIVDDGSGTLYQSPVSAEVPFTFT